MTKPSVYSFQSFAEFFAAYMEWMKGVNTKFSLRWLAKRLGLKSHTHIVNFASGTKAPTDEMLIRLCDILGLSVDEYLYVKNLLGLQIARNDTEKVFYKNKLAELKRAQPAAMISLDTFQLIAQWHNIVIYEMSSMPDFQGEVAWIAQKLRFALSNDSIEETLERLTRLGLLAKNEDGRRQRAQGSLSTPHNVPSDAIRNFHKQMLELASESLESTPVDQRILLGFTMPFDTSKRQEAQNLLIEFRTRFALLMEGGNIDSVYHLALQFFPATR